MMNRSKYNLSRSDSDDAKTIMTIFVVLLKILIHPSFHHIEGKSHFCRASHCNGIIRLSPFCDKTVLYNPTIREFKVLPKTFLDPHAFSVGELTWVEGEGLGFDLKADDYYFIRILTKLSCIS